MSDDDRGSVRGCVKERVAHVAVPKLITPKLWDVERGLTVGADQTEIDGRRRLQLDFQYLISNIWKLAVVCVCRVTEALTNKAVEVRTPPTFLIVSAVWKGSPY